MNKIEQVAKPVAHIGEDIGLAEGASMVQAYRQANPTDTISHTVGRDILLQMLAQPGCEGINIASAAKENGERTLVFVGVDAQGKAITSYPVVNINGQLEQQDAIVADRIRTGTSNTEQEIWEYIVKTIFGL
jgi:hypothetical protein